MDVVPYQLCALQLYTFPTDLGYMRKHLHIYLIIDARAPVLLETNQCHLHQGVLEVQYLKASELLVPPQPLSLTAKLNVAISGSATEN